MVCASLSSLNGLFWSVDLLRESIGKATIVLCVSVVFMDKFLRIENYLYRLLEFQVSAYVALLLVLLFVAFPAFKNPVVVFIKIVF